MNIRDEAYEKEKEMKRRSSFDVWVGVAIGRCVRFVSKMILGLVSMCALTLAWLALGFFAEWRLHNLWVFIAAFAIFTLWHPSFRRYSPIWGDLVRFENRRKFRKQMRVGNELLVHMGVVKPVEQDEELYKVRLVETRDESRLYVDEPISGVPSSTLVDVCRSYRDRLDAKRVRVHERGHGVIEISFMRNDPLDVGQEIDQPAEFDPGEMKVTCAVDAEGKKTAISFKEVSGMVIGGIPGSGKTAGVTSFMLPLAMSDDVELTIIDGKGGDDWSAYQPIVDQYVSGDDDLELIRDVLSKVHDDMVARVQSNRERLGQSNFWNTSVDVRREAGAKFKLLIIDECQGLFETAGRSSKEEKAVLGEILRYSTSLVKRGRSAGVCVVFITQKPTSEALPTAIRDNAALRLSFRLTTSESERAVLGMLPDDVDVPRPTAIPHARKGGAIMARDTGELVEVRFFYMPENRQVQLIEGVSAQ